MVRGRGGISSGVHLVIFTNRSLGSANALFSVIKLIKYSPAPFVVDTFIGLSISSLFVVVFRQIISCQSVTFEYKINKPDDIAISLGDIEPIGFNEPSLSSYIIAPI